MTAEQLLKRLPEVDPERFHWSDRYQAVFLGSFASPEDTSLSISRDGKLQGWEALGAMLVEMQERYRSLHAKVGKGIADGFPFAEEEEFRILRKPMDTKGQDLTPELILSTYVAWKEVLVKIGGEG